ncbi:MAG: phenylacetate-CoA oxygenase subunit PaaJ [Gammaproteobacteria bacterium]|nr:phenylacetate-CoA oxygenase subunit PaaJ [Gammaproteobacteria bacterium]MCZ6855496.1 phenylacetate-CoA oxygenase subunit PaaJ [Gammaproteobacteria bacterium]
MVDRVHFLDEETRDQRVWRILATVADPEIPVLSVVDLGIVRHLRWLAADGLEVGITPTYSGCPATEVIRDSVRTTLCASGYPNVRVVEVLSPPWSSAWISEAGRMKLQEYGIAPPGCAADAAGGPVCPRCEKGEGESVELISEFGSTPCKALYRCLTCLEPFEYFKPF